MPTKIRASWPVIEEPYDEVKWQIPDPKARKMSTFQSFLRKEPVHALNKICPGEMRGPHVFSQ